jgi:hypothetical protein
MPSRIIGGYKLQFYSADQHEPPHIHVVKAEKRANIWLNDFSVAWSRRFSSRELNRVLKILEEYQEELTEWYYGFFV